MWKWNSRARRYYDDESGQFMGRDGVLGYVQAIIDTSGPATDTLAKLVAEARLSPEDWRLLMRQEIKMEYIGEYILGRGGLPQMIPEDWGSLGGMLREQYEWLDGFYDQVARGELSEAQIAARSRMYVRSAREGHERANGRAWGDPPLPAYPGDGSTACKTNCACSWDIRSAEATEEGMSWTCHWTLGIADHCADCLTRSEEWNPLIVSV